MAIDPQDIAELPTQVAITGALQQTDAWGDEIFDYTVGVVIIVSGGIGG